MVITKRNLGSDIKGSLASLEKGQLTSSKELRDVFHSTFPQHQEEIVYAFGYGSGVFLQQDQNAEEDMSTTEEKKMLDIILIVKDALQFHSLNTQVNPSHYAPLFRDPSRATWWQKHNLSNSIAKNPKIFFNFVQEPFLKYGIMETSDLCSDLQHWDSLYIAGRMHKPTAVIFQQEGSQVDFYQQNYNLPAALSTALLLSVQDSLSLAELYSKISALSYTGDFRMQVGAEDPGKINKLVNSPGQLQRFHQMYNGTALQPLVQSGVLSLSSDDRVSWNPKDPAAISHLRQRLPQRLHHRVDANASQQTTIRGLQEELHAIVAPAARYQSFKGLWTAGLAKGASYAFAKLSKGILRRR